MNSTILYHNSIGRWILPTCVSFMSSDHECNFLRQLWNSCETFISKAHRTFACGEMCLPFIVKICDTSRHLFDIADLCRVVQSKCQAGMPSKQFWWSAIPVHEHLSFRMKRAPKYTRVACFGCKDCAYRWNSARGQTGVYQKCKHCFKEYYPTGFAWKEPISLSYPLIWPISCFKTVISSQFMISNK